MIMTIEQLENIVINALYEAYQVHEDLGETGKQLVQKNQFGDTALKVDIEAEQVILTTLREAQLSIRVISEEHGTVDIGDNPIYLGILDGLDGSGVYKSLRGTG